MSPYAVLHERNYSTQGRFMVYEGGIALFDNRMSYTDGSTTQLEVDVIAPLSPSQ